MRDWMRDLMRRRSRRGPNESESTGKSGQELPSNQLAPLRPSYPEPLAQRQPSAVPAVTTPASPPKSDAMPPPEPEKKIVVETQPDSLGTPPAE